MGEAGKCTLLRQMTRLLRGPFSIDQRNEARKNILTDIVRYCKFAIEEMKDKKIKFSTTESEVRPVDLA